MCILFFTLLIFSSQGFISWLSLQAEDKEATSTKTLLFFPFRHRRRHPKAATAAKKKDESFALLAVEKCQPIS